MKLRPKDSLKHSFQRSIVAFGLAFLFATACTTQAQKKSDQVRKPAAVLDANGPDDLPVVIDAAPQLDEEIKKALKKPFKGMAPEEAARITKKLRNYLLFLGLNAKDLQKAKAAAPLEASTEPEAPRPVGGLAGGEEVAEAGAGALNAEAPPAVVPPTAPPEVGDTEGGDDDDQDKTPSNLKAVKRLFQGSSQFLFCENFLDWECLEKKPPQKPLAAFRQEFRDDLGVAVHAGDKLDMEVFFTQAWDKKKVKKTVTEIQIKKKKVKKVVNGRTVTQIVEVKVPVKKVVEVEVSSPPAGVAQRLGERIRDHSGRALSMAMFGIDDKDGSMKPVWDAIQERSQDKNVSVRAVVDVMGVERNATPWIYDYVPSRFESVDMLNNWLFGPSKDATKPNAMHATFQYENTPDLIRGLNDGIQSNDESRVRIEWPSSGIMHNKFLVLEDQEGKKAVWSGTANLSKNCMGIERNANMSVFVKNDAIAQAYQDEFDHMHGFDESIISKSKVVMPYKPLGAMVMPNAINPPLPLGRFHRNKLPTSKRLFEFDDGTKFRVHFAPTDDAEHRVILPMLLSAREGDIIRISMFGGTGYEIVRAMQFAAAKGAEVRIAFDRKLGAGCTSWIRDGVLNVFMPNPYTRFVKRNGAPGKILVRTSTWEGKNHYKVGTLTRKLPTGEMFAEQIIVGSQNWSSGGNDANDENLMSIQNLVTPVRAAELFNQEFDNHIWKESLPKTKASMSCAEKAALPPPVVPGNGNG